MNFSQQLMEKKSKYDNEPFLKQLSNAAKQGKISHKFEKIIASFYHSYKKALTDEGLSIQPCLANFEIFFQLLEKQIETPYLFPPYHERIRTPFDYYAFGLDFLRPLIDKKRSALLGVSYLDEIAQYLKNKENVILLANHQTEPDPQAISLILEDKYPKIGEEMIFIAGERVVTDPLAIPFSMGRNLLCIYSKRYIDNPPELKMQKQLHNKRTMELMANLLSEGGKSIYVAPSGGRDRANESGVVEVAPFDPQSIEMLYLMAKKSIKKTHFFSLALATYDFLPPPQTIQTELGEERKTKRGGVALAFGPEIDMENYPGSENSNKHARRKDRADYIWQQVKKDYILCKEALS